MIEERAIVTRVENGQVFVQALNMGNCKPCAEGRGCGGGLLGRLARHRKYAIEVNTQVRDLQSGDAVVVGIAGDALLRASALVYLLPLVGMIGLGAFARLTLQAGDALVAAFAVAGLAAGLLVVRWKSLSIDATRFRPMVLRRDRFGADSCPRLNQE
ncbi:SoxR reducing system RseC family protein [Algiphilus sp.]|uniref:SoxR reducing system RseC family protein n=1 Tax=Algiphilus sp. TaxID=1872431 RepID=UPI0025BCBD3B|nr:SoxR reducing system RseC family protein [Algiphilus sp.]MCK5769762.1 SoxR reducing system RseC family protein [Algiphilus sp.]